LTHSVLWSFLFNILFYVAGSISYRPAKLERTQLAEFMNALKTGQSGHKARPTGLDRYIRIDLKRREAVQLLTEYLPLEKTEAAIERISEDLLIANKEHVTIIELVEFHRMLEQVLSGAIGAASAHKAIESRIKYDQRETRDLKAIYSHILTELHGQSAAQNATPAPPDEEDGNRYSLIETLQNKIDDHETQLQEQQHALDRAVALRDSSDQKLFEQRLLNQKLVQEVKTLRGRLATESEDSAAL